MQTMKLLNWIIQFIKSTAINSQLFEITVELKLNGVNIINKQG